MTRLDINFLALQAAIGHCADIAKTAKGARAQREQSNICDVVANLIAAMNYGSASQKLLMDHALAAGFQPSYYGGGIRVEFTPAKAPKAT